MYFEFGTLYFIELCTVHTTHTRTDTYFSFSCVNSTKYTNIQIEEQTKLKMIHKQWHWKRELKENGKRSKQI